MDVGRHVQCYVSAKTNRARPTEGLGDEVAVLAVDGDKLGDVLLRVRTEKGNLLYAGDYIANIRSLPKHLIFRLLFKLTDSAPGLKVFNVFVRSTSRIAPRRAISRPASCRPIHPRS